MKRVVIVGGGFGGIFTAKKLCKRNVEVVLISNINYFLFTPLLHEVAVGEVNRHHIVHPIRQIFSDKKFKFYKAHVNKVDTKKKEVYFDDQSVSYDYLVMAAGGKTNYYGIKGAEKNTINLKSMENAIKIRDALVSSLERAATLENKKEILKLLTYVVIGAGPTGVELMGDIADFLEENIRKNYPELRKYEPRLYLIEAGKNIIPILHRRCSIAATKLLKRKGVRILTDARVTEVQKEKIVINGKRNIKSGTIIWTGGVKPNPLETKPNVQDKRGYFPVNKYLQVTRNIYSIGDCSFFEENPYPNLAQVAVKQSEIVAHNIISDIKKKKKKEFNFFNRGVLISVGQRYAVGQIYLFREKPWIVKGVIPWFIKRHTYFMNLPGLQNKIRVGIEWFLNLIFDRDISEI